MDELISHPVGSVVMLNSGGPFMSVVYVRDDGYVEVTWQGDLGTQEHAFPAASLTRVGWWSRLMRGISR